MQRARFVVDPRDPRAPAQELWDKLSDEERRQILAELPSEWPRAMPPEGDLHRLPKNRALEALDEFYRRIRRRVYVSAELPVYYPEEPMFAPDLLAVLDVEVHERMHWVVSHERRGLDFVLEISVAGDRKKDFEQNVVRYARLGIPEYFAFDVTRARLVGWRLPDEGSRTYEAIIPQSGRWRSSVLGLDLSLEQGHLRFYHGNAALLDSRELIAKLSTMVDDAIRRAEEESRRAEEESRRAEEESRRAEEESRRADKLAARLRELGEDPDKLR
jgi:Uma2 family endonuclease